MASIGRIDPPHTAHPGAASINRKGLVALGRGQPVVLLHGTLSSKAQWTELAQHMAARFQAIALDLHGYGDHRAMPGPRDFSIDDEIDLVLAGLDALLGCNAAVHLVGHSYGGLVALQFALRHPKLVESLVLYDPVAITLLAEDDPSVAGMRSMGRAMAEHVAHRRHFEAAQLFFDFWSGAGAFARLSLPSKTKVAASAGQLALNFHGTTGSPLRADILGHLRVPTLVLTGSRSPLFCRRIVELLAVSMPAAKLIWVEGDHMAPIDAPERVNAWIETFIDVQAARRGVD